MADYRTDDQGFIVKDDPTDLGVPMRLAPAGWTHQGPEDALGDEPTRGDYRDRIAGGPSVQIEAVLPPDAPYGTVPTIRAVEQGPRAGGALLPDPGGPLDAADPNFERLAAQRRAGHR